MLTIDWIMLAILVAGAVRGWQLGCVRQLVSLVAFFAGLIVAKMFYMMLGEAIAPHLGDHATVANLLAFVLIWVAVPTVLSMVGEVLNTILDKLFVLGTINRMLGTLLCFVKFHLIIGAVVRVFASAGVISATTMQQSVLCGVMKAAPEALYSALMENGREE